MKKGSRSKHVSSSKARTARALHATANAGPERGGSVFGFASPPLFVPEEHDPFSFASWSAAELEQAAQLAKKNDFVSSVVAPPPPLHNHHETAASSVPVMMTPSAPALPVEVERVLLESREVAARLAETRSRCERAERDLEAARTEAAFLRGQCTSGEAELLALRMESVALARERLEDRDGGRAARLESELARTRAELEEKKREAAEMAEMARASEARAGLAKMELAEAKRSCESKAEQMKTMERAKAEWQREKQTLEKHANAWLGRLDELKRKEEQAKELVADDVAELERTLAREGCRAFLKLLYRKHPPKDGKTKLNDLSNLDRALKLALVAYHQDKQDFQLHGLTWQAFCTQVCAILNNERASQSRNY